MMHGSLPLLTSMAGRCFSADISHSSLSSAPTTTCYLCLLVNALCRTHAILPTYYLNILRKTLAIVRHATLTSSFSRKVGQRELLDVPTACRYDAVCYDRGRRS